MKLFYFDVETTGLSCNEHEIIQIAGIIEIDGEITEEFNYNLSPTNWEVITPEALEITHKTLEELKTYPDPKSVFRSIRSIFDKYIDKYDRNDKFYPAGHNVQFDIGFLQAGWLKYIDKYGTGSYQNWRILDTRILANFLIVHGLINPKNVTLVELCKIYNIELDAHDAMNDIRATRQLHLAMIEHWKTL